MEWGLREGFFGVKSIFWVWRLLERNLAVARYLSIPCRYGSRHRSMGQHQAAVYFHGMRSLVPAWHMRGSAS